MKRIVFLIMLVAAVTVNAQYKSFLLLDNGDTLNRLDNNDMKQGRWKVHVNALRLDPAYDEEGMFVNNRKEGVWRRYDMFGVPMAQENYKWGQKNGLQQYMDQGRLQRDETWRAIDPNKKFDTIDVNDVYDQYKVERRVIKVESYSLPVGVWHYYDPETGYTVKKEEYNALGELMPEKKDVAATAVNDSIPKKVAKPKAVMDFEKSGKGKKSIKVRDARGMGF